MTYKKNIGSTAKFIHDLCEQKEVTISGIVPAKKEGQCSFNFDAGLMEVTLSTDNTDESIEEIETSRNGSDTANPLRVKSDSGCYVATTAYRSLTELYCCDSVVREKPLFSLSQLMSSEWDCKKKYYYRFLVPRPPGMFIWNSIQTDSSYSTPDNDRPDNLVKISLEKERQIHVFLSGVKFDQNKLLEYLTIESQVPCTYTEMHEYMYAISLSLGLVTTIAPFDYAFFVASKTLDFDGNLMGGFVQLRPTIKSQYRFIMTDHGFVCSLLECLRRILCEKCLLELGFGPMQEQDFSGLVSMLHKSKDLARAALMLIDSSMNLECMGVTYAVALETICSVLIEANKGLLPKHLKKNGEEGKRKNKEKLTEPFMLPQIGYGLSEEKGKELVNIRNSFLHGGVLGFSHTEYHKLQYPCMKLRCFCGTLLLRYSGYKGPILNNAVEMGLKEAIENEEPLFITYDEEAAKELVEKRKKEKQKEEEEEKKRKSKSRQKQHTKSRQEQQAKSRQKQHANQSKNNTRNQGKEKSPQPTEEPEASV